MSAARLVALDWGTSSLRAFLFAAGGRVLAQRQQPWGIQRLPAGGFDAALDGIAGEWLAAAGPLPLIACGMVGSAQGWREAPYVPCPADPAALAAALVACDIGQGRVLYIVPGVSHARPDVMRGEETQVLGAMVELPRLAGRATLVLPGTHSKWVDLRDGRIDDFSTYLSGELFAVLREHSILGRLQREAAANGASTTDDSPEVLQAFDRGVRAVREQGSATPLLFSTRALVLAGRLRAEDSMMYLSGLLIGDELRCALSGRARDDALVLTGDDALCLRYRRALSGFGGREAMLLPNTAAAGLWRLALQAGLVQAG